MNSILVKLGKISRTLREEGLLRGSFRIISSGIDYLKLFLRFYGAGDVLFVVGGVGASSLYRGHNVSEELGMHGFKTAVIISDNPFLQKFAEKYKVFVFHRTEYSENIKIFVEKIKSEKGFIVFDADDLLFDVEQLKHIDYLKKMNSLERKLFDRGLGREIVDDPSVSVCTTTTSFLKERLERMGKRVFLLPNRINNKELSIAERIYQERVGCKKESDNRAVKLGYFSGTASHDRDFAVISRALVRILEKHAELEIFLGGPLDAGNDFLKFQGRIKRIPFVSRERNFENIASIDINLLPLEIGNPFCESKSELKFFEAGVVGVPTIASATRTLKEAIADGKDGFLAENEEEWFSKLDILISDSKKRRLMGEEARKKTLSRYTNRESDNQEYYEFLRKIINRP